MSELPSRKGDANVFVLADGSNLRELFKRQNPDHLTPEKKEKLVDAILTFSRGCIKDAVQMPHIQSKEALVKVWEVFAKAAQLVEWNDSFHDRLICLLLWTREFDVLRKTLRPEESETRQSWECHQLIEVMQKSWKGLVLGVHDTTTQQCNLASFTATALAIGGHDWLGITALWYLREALEMTDKRTLYLAPVTIIWIRTAGAKLLTFSILEKTWVEQNADNDALNLVQIQKPGRLARLAGITKTGFSLDRWAFWKERFVALARDEDEEASIWANDTVAYMSEFDSMMVPETIKRNPRDEEKDDRRDGLLIDDSKKENKLQHVVKDNIDSPDRKVGVGRGNGKHGDGKFEADVDTYQSALKKHSLDTRYI